MKRPKDASPFALRHSDPIVGDVNDGPGGACGHAHSQPRRTGGVGEAVVDQVVQDATELACIGFHLHRFRVQRGRDVRPVELGTRPRPFDRRQHDVSEIHRAALALERVRFDPGGVEQVGHDPVHVPGLVGHDVEYGRPPGRRGSKLAVGKQCQVAGQHRERCAQLLGRHVDGVGLGRDRKAGGLIQPRHLLVLLSRIDERREQE